MNIQMAINEAPHDFISDIESVTTPTTINDEHNHCMMQIPVSRFERATKYGYDNDMIIIRYLLFRFENVKYEEERCKIAEKLFQYLINYPTILLYESSLMNIVLNKMDEFEEYIEARCKMYEREDYFRIIDNLGKSLHDCMTHSRMRSAINVKLAEIHDILHSYESWLPGRSLRRRMTNLRATIQSLTTHPNYVE
jgi:hypothetical protein